MKLKLPRIPRPHWPRRHDRPETAPAVVPVGGILGGMRTVALALITGIVTAASAAAFAESYHSLFVWARRHGYAGFWSAVYPLQVDSFIVVGELALIVAMTDRWTRRDRIAAWTVAFAGLTASIAGNIGHIGAADIQSRGTAAVPPLAAFAALWVGLGVLKRVVYRRTLDAAPDALSPSAGGTDQSAHDTPSPDAAPDAHWSPVPDSSESAALASMRATLAAGNPWSGRQLETRFGLNRAQATRVRQAVLAETNGYHAGNGTGNADQ